LQGIVLPQVSGAVFSFHLDLVEHGIAAVGDSTATPTADFLFWVVPFAGLAKLVEYPLNLFVQALGPSGCRPLGQCFGVGEDALNQTRRIRRCVTALG
jgi:hypothetical protein